MTSGVFGATTLTSGPLFTHAFPLLSFDVSYFYWILSTFLVGTSQGGLETTIGTFGCALRDHDGGEWSI